MSMSDPLGDMLTRIRNGQQAQKKSVPVKASTLHADVLEVLKREGYIRGYSWVDLRPGVRELTVDLKYNSREPAIREINRVSRPGRRVYTGITNLALYYNGLGVSILSTPKGILSDHEARRENVGGEILCRVF